MYDVPREGIIPTISSSWPGTVRNPITPSTSPIMSPRLSPGWGFAQPGQAVCAPAARQVNGVDYKMIRTSQNHKKNQRDGFVDSDPGFTF